MHTKITKRVLENTLLPATGERFVRDTELTGFGVRVTSKGSISFFAAGRLRRSRTKRISLGRFPVIDIETARERARETLCKLNLGIDPHQQERERLASEACPSAHQQACAVTLSQVIDDYFRSRPIKSEDDYRGVLKNSFAGLMEKPIRQISRQYIEKRYRHLAFEKGKKAQAAKAMRYLNAVMNFAKAEMINGQALITDNPADVLKDKKIDRVVQPRNHYIPKEKLGDVIRAVISECRDTTRDVVLLELFTGLRDSEAKNLGWDNVDLERQIITINSTKNRKPHVLGMGHVIFAMLKRRYEYKAHEIFVFPNRSGTGSLGNVRKQLIRVHQKAGISFTHHDC